MEDDALLRACILYLETVLTRIWSSEEAARTCPIQRRSLWVSSTSNSYSRKTKLLVLVLIHDLYILVEVARAYSSNPSCDSHATKTSSARPSASVQLASTIVSAHGGALHIEIAHPNGVTSYYTQVNHYGRFVVHCTIVNRICAHASCTSSYIAVQLLWVVVCTALARRIEHAYAHTECSFLYGVAIDYGIVFLRLVQFWLNTVFARSDAALD